ncbi:MAG: ABC transporter substrate-binding protein [Actinomycetota bacterium]
MRSASARLIALLLALTLVAAACGDSDDTDATDAAEGEVAAEGEAPADTEAPAATEAPEGEVAAEGEAPADTEGSADTEAPAATDLSAVCPSPIVVQTDWFPSPEHAYLYRLVGEAGELDAEAGAYRGPLGDTGVDLEIRAGGPYLGFQPTNSILYQDDGIHLGYVTLDEGVQSAADFPTVAIVAPLEINPQILMWDPNQYSFETFADIGATDVTVLYFDGGVYMDYLVASGQIGEDQIDGSYDGSPARFVATEGGVVQQGFATSEPWNYENLYEEWGQPVDFLLVHDSGYEVYSQPLAGRPEVVEEFADCWAEFVPLVQESVIGHALDPDATNELILDIVDELDAGWVLAPGQMDYSVESALELGVYANGPDDTVGNFDPDRVATFVELLAPLLDSAPADLDPTSLYTNDFIDPSIGFSE